MYYENLELLREKNPLFAFSLAQEKITTSILNREYPLSVEAEIYFIYDPGDPREFFPLIEKGRELCFIFTDPSQTSIFLQSKASTLLLKNPKVAVYLLGEGEEEYKQIGWRYLFMKRAHLVSLQGNQLIRDRLENMIASIELVASDYREFGVDVLHNVYSNLRSLDSVIFAADLQKYFPRRPVLVCGAGPSLLHQLEEIRGLYDQLFILGCGSAIPILMESGIRPHMVAFIDPDPPIDPFRALENFDMPLLYQSRMSKDIFKLHKGAKIWMGSSGGYLIEKWLDDELGFPDHFFDGGWNVANFGIRAMAELGASSIYFIGVDSCYAKEVVEPHEWLLKDVHGKLQVTRKDLFMGAKWIGDFAKEHSHVPIVNVGGSGLFIDGVQTCTLEELKKTLPAWYPACITFNEVKEHRVDRARSLGLLMEIEASLHRSKEKVEVCLEMFQKQSETAASALFDVEIKDELAHNLLLKPMWDIWKHMILRESSRAEKLQELLFFYRVLERHLEL